jgi:hypothetical protein
MGRLAPHRFVAEDLGGAEICVDCARTLVPGQVAAAEEFDDALPDDESPS